MDSALILPPFSYIKNVIDICGTSLDLILGTRRKKYKKNKKELVKILICHAPVVLIPLLFSLSAARVALLP